MPFLRLLPKGHDLPDDLWRQRHRGFIVLLWLHAIGLPIFGLVRGYSLRHSLLEGSLVAVAALLASIPRTSRSFGSVVVTIGLLTSSGLLVHLSGGTIEAHFHFFVMVTLIPLYQSWLPFLLAIGYVVVHHAIIGLIAPTAVFNHPAALENPIMWAVIHGLFILGASVAGLMVWKRNEELLTKVEALQELKVRERHALELNDQIVQGLVVAKMAATMGQPDMVQDSIEATLASARRLVSEYLPQVAQAGDFVRKTPAATVAETPPPGSAAV